MDAISKITALNEPFRNEELRGKCVKPVFLERRVRDIVTISDEARRLSAQAQYAGRLQ